MQHLSNPHEPTSRPRTCQFAGMAANGGEALHTCESIIYALQPYAPLTWSHSLWAPCAFISSGTTCVHGLVPDMLARLEKQSVGTDRPRESPQLLHDEKQCVIHCA